MHRKVFQSQDMKRKLQKTNLYEILEIKQNASDLQIKKSYKKLALIYHPDKNSAENSKELFTKLSDAYNTLNDPQKRQIYNDKINSPSKTKINVNFKEENTQDNRYNSANRNFNDQNMDQEFHMKFHKLYRHNKQKFQNNFTNNKKDSKIWTSSKVFTQKSQFGQRTSNRQNRSQYKSQVQRKLRLQKQKQKYSSNIHSLKYIALALFVWFVFGSLTPPYKNQPTYSMQQTLNHPYKQETNILGSPFYITKQYLQTKKGIGQHSQRKIDLYYIKALSKLCNKNKQQQKAIIQRLSTLKSKKSIKKLNQQLRMIDMAACQQLTYTRQLNPTYFKSLFVRSNQYQT